MLIRLMRRIYKQRRGLELVIDEALLPTDIISFGSRKMTELIRATIRGLPGCFLGSNIRLLHRSHLSVGPGVSIGHGVEINAISKSGVHLAQDVTIDAYSIIRGSGVIRNLGHGVRVGTKSSIGAHNFIHGGGGVEIGSNCLLGPYVSIYSENHIFNAIDIPIREQGEARQSVLIQDDVWIGSGSTILAGVTVGAGSIIAAGAVVNCDIPPGSMFGGIPAKEIGRRYSSESTPP